MTYPDPQTPMAQAATIIITRSPKTNAIKIALGIVATFFAFLLNTTSQGVVGALSNASAGEAFAAVISAPIVEETGKAFILFIFFFWKKDEFDGVVDGIVYASLSALGFAMTENVLYYGKAAA